MKRTLALISMLLVLLASGTALADGSMVYDDAMLFSDEEAAALNEALATMSEKYGMDFAIHTADSGVGWDTGSYAMEYSESIGLGRESAGSALFLLDMENRISYIDTTGRMIEIIDDARREEILDAQMGELADGDYAAAMSIALIRTEQFIQEGAKDDLYVYDEETGEVLTPEEYGVDDDLGIVGVLAGVIIAAPIGLIAGFITKFIIKRSYAKKYKPVPYDSKNNAELRLTLSNTRETGRTITKRRIERDTDSGSGGSGSSTRSSSSGTRHGGGGRSF